MTLITENQAYVIRIEDVLTTRKNQKGGSGHRTSNKDFKTPIWNGNNTPARDKGKHSTCKGDKLGMH